MRHKTPYFINLKRTGYKILVKLESSLFMYNSSFSRIKLLYFSGQDNRPYCLTCKNFIYFTIHISQLPDKFNAHFIVHILQLSDKFNVQGDGLLSRSEIILSGAQRISSGKRAFEFPNIFELSNATWIMLGNIFPSEQYSPQLRPTCKVKLHTYY